MSPRGELACQVVEKGLAHLAPECDPWLAFLTAFNTGRSQLNIYGDESYDEVRIANEDLDVKMKDSSSPIDTEHEIEKRQLLHGLVFAVTILSSARHP